MFKAINFYKSLYWARLGAHGLATAPEPKFVRAVRAAVGPGGWGDFRLVGDPRGPALRWPLP